MTAARATQGLVLAVNRLLHSSAICLLGLFSSAGYWDIILGQCVPCGSCSVIGGRVESNPYRKHQPNRRKPGSRCSVSKDFALRGTVPP
uniref:Putative secreted protein n=1 Tax=Anopheles triannulatus TaxID=58253 RepID=A0A2M4B6Z8_9DIPT